LRVPYKNRAFHNLMYLAILCNQKVTEILTDFLWIS
jgi:hypothetical protein